MIPDFLLVSAPPWVELENASTLVGQAGMDAGQFAAYTAQDDYVAISQWAEDLGICAVGQTIVSAKIFDVGSDDSLGTVNVRIFLIKS